MRLLSPDRLLGVILIAVLTILLLVVIWSLDRGLDITDESLTLLSYLYPGEYPANFSMSYTIVDRITGWMHPSVVGYRWITLALILLTATAFFCGFWQWLRRFVAAEPRRAVSLAVVFPYLLIGWLSVYGIGLVTLNYNTLNSACLASVAGLLFYILAHVPRRGVQPGRIVAGLFMVGFFSALDLFVKFPTAIIMFGGAVLLIVLHMRRLGRRTIAFAIGIQILGAMAGLAAYFADVRSITAWLSNYPGQLRVVSQVSHSPGTLLLSYMRVAESLGLFLLRHFSVVFLMSFIIARCYARGWYRNTLRNQHVLLAMLTLTLLYTAYKIYALDLLNSPYFNNWASFYMYVLIICFQVVVLLATYRTGVWAPKPNQEAVQRLDLLLGIGLLVAFPFVGAIGTTNNIFLNTLIDIGGWFALILILGLLIEERTRSRFVLSLCILLPACLGATQLIHGRVWKPYLLAASLPAQTITLEQPASVAGLKVDSATAKFIADLRSILRRGSFHKHDYILAFYNAPELVLLMDGVSLGTPYYMKGENPINCRALESAEIKKRPVFILATRKIDFETVACLQKVGLRFPVEFVELGRIYNPYSASSYGWRRNEPWVSVFRQKGIDPF